LKNHFYFLLVQLFIKENSGRILKKIVRAVQTIMRAERQFHQRWLDEAEGQIKRLLPQIQRKEQVQTSKKRVESKLRIQPNVSPR